MSYQNHFKQFVKQTPESENDNLKQKEINDLEAAIKNSKETAIIEEQSREIQKKFYKSKNTNNSDDSIKTTKPALKKLKSQGDSKFEQEFKITFQDFPEDSGKSLDIVYHSPIFNLPIIINPECNSYNIQQKVKILMNYYTRIGKLQAKLARDSIQRAPYPKPIVPTHKYKYSTVKKGTEEIEENGNFDDFLDQPLTQETYVSRAGRQVKRKIYTEDTEGDSDTDLALFNKKNKIEDSDTKITLDIPYIPEENHDKEKPKSIKTRKDTPKRPSGLSLKKSVTSRSELLFNKVIEEDEKRMQQEEEMEIFKRTLPNLEESEKEIDILEASPAKETRESNSNFFRRRVPPPIPIKKGGRGRKPKPNTDRNSNQRKSSSPPSSPVLKRYTNLTRSSEAKKGRPSNSKEPSEVSTSKLEKTSCPICNREFLQSEIMNHAAACGDEDTYEDFIENNSFCREKIKCELCDKEFMVSTDYEVHVKQCIASSVTDM